MLLTLRGSVVVEHRLVEHWMTLNGVRQVGGARAEEAVVTHPLRCYGNHVATRLRLFHQPDHVANAFLTVKLHTNKQINVSYQIISYQGN